MRENRTSGSEGRESETNRTSLPLFSNMLFLRADARSYVLPSLRDSRVQLQNLRVGLMWRQVNSFLPLARKRLRRDESDDASSHSRERFHHEQHTRLDDPCARAV